MNKARLLGVTKLFSAGKKVFFLWSCSSCHGFFHSVQIEGIVKCPNCGDKLELNPKEIEAELASRL